MPVKPADASRAAPATLLYECRPVRVAIERSLAWYNAQAAVTARTGGRGLRRILRPAQNHVLEDCGILAWGLPSEKAGTTTAAEGDGECVIDASGIATP